jgi:hypothetical protein
LVFFHEGREQPSISGSFCLIIFRKLTTSASLHFAELPKLPDICSNAWIFTFHARNIAIGFLILIRFQTGFTSTASISDFGLLSSFVLHDNMILVFPFAKSRILWLIIDHAPPRNSNAMLPFGIGNFVSTVSSRTSTVISRPLQHCSCAIMVVIPFP